MNIKQTAWLILKVAIAPVIADLEYRNTLKFPASTTKDKKQMLPEARVVGAAASAPGGAMRGTPGYIVAGELSSSNPVVGSR